MICGGEGGPNGCHLAGFSEHIAFVRHFVATSHAPSHSIGVHATGIAYTPVKKLSKMAGNLAKLFSQQLVGR